MSENIVRNLALLLCLVWQPSERPPLVLDDAPTRVSYLTERPSIAEGMEAELWFDASTQAYISLVRAYVNERVIFGVLPDSFAGKRWWDRTLQEDPAALAAALSLADEHYSSWDIGQWPDSLDSAKPLIDSR